MTKILISVKANGNADQFGGRDSIITHAISNDEQELIKYCNLTFGKPVGKPAKFSWDEYYEIQDSQIEIV